MRRYRSALIRGPELLDTGLSGISSRDFSSHGIRDEDLLVELPKERKPADCREANDR
jgi:hypothetical protein